MTITIRHILLCLSICCVVPSVASAAQFDNSLSGQIIDASTGEPVYYVNVFLANTTIGTTTNDKGHYVFKNIPPGHYSLVFSHISYEMVVEKIMVRSDSKNIYNAALEPGLIEMEPLQVNQIRDRTWRALFERFEKEFLGYSDNAEACEFENPEVMHLVNDEDENLFYGKTLLPLEMTHHNFGYKVSIIIRSFRVTDSRVSFIVLPVYSEMQPNNEKQLETWRDNRKNAFYGSYRHFFYSLFFRQLEEAGFTVESVEDAKRFRSYTETFTSQSAVNEIYSNTDYGLLKKVHFQNFLRIRHNNNWAQTSFLKLPFDTVVVDLSGNTLSDFKIERLGYWGQRRFAERLPIDYLPQ